MESLIMNPQISNHGMMDKQVTFSQDFQLINVSSPTSSSSIGAEEEDHDESFEEEEEVNSSANYPRPLQDMSSLLQHLPFKRGLSKHYNGKSQSFTSLLSVTSLEDLAKPENPLNKKLKTCKSYGVFQRTNDHTTSRGFIGKKSSNINNIGTRSKFLCSSSNNSNNRPTF